LRSKAEEGSSFHHLVSADLDVGAVRPSDIVADPDQEPAHLLVHCASAPDFLSSLEAPEDRLPEQGQPADGPWGALLRQPILYLLIAMWIFPTIPEKMLMVIAMIFGAHLMPYSWLYESKSYLAFSIAIPFVALFVGLNFEPFVLAAVIILLEATFSVLLIHETKGLRDDS
jgi:hypothetical protein